MSLQILSLAQKASSLAVIEWIFLSTYRTQWFQCELSKWKNTQGMLSDPASSDFHGQCSPMNGGQPRAVVPTFSEWNRSMADRCSCLSLVCRRWS